jgi:hypothetical protein
MYIIYSCPLTKYIHADLFAHRRRRVYRPRVSSVYSRYREWLSERKQQRQSESTRETGRELINNRSLYSYIYMYIYRSRYSFAIADVNPTANRPAVLILYPHTSARLALFIYTRRLLSIRIAQKYPVRYIYIYIYIFICVRRCDRCCLPPRTIRRTDLPITRGLTTDHNNI